MATIYCTDGTIKDVQPKNGHDFELEQMQAIVGGYIEVVPVGEKLLVCNEEGKLNGLDYNARASNLFGKYLPGDYLVGNILVCEAWEIE